MRKTIVLLLSIPLTAVTLSCSNTLSSNVTRNDKVSSSVSVEEITQKVEATPSKSSNKAEAVKDNSSQTKIIGTLLTKPIGGFGCYAVLEKDWNKSEEKPFIFLDSEDERKGYFGVFNLFGRDVRLPLKNSSAKGNQATWIFSDGKTEATFNLLVEKKSNEGADTLYRGTLKVVSGDKSETVKIKAFCGG